jgi:hypothetical protein
LTLIARTPHADMYRWRVRASQSRTRANIPLDWGRAMTPDERQRMRQMQRDAIWKWRWLGLRNSTPGFKGSLVLIAVAAIAIFAPLLRG